MKFGLKFLKASSAGFFASLLCMNDAYATGITPKSCTQVIYEGTVDLTPHQVGALPRYDDVRNNFTRYIGHAVQLLEKFSLLSGSGKYGPHKLILSTAARLRQVGLAEIQKKDMALLDVYRLFYLVDQLFYVVYGHEPSITFAPKDLSLLDLSTDQITSWIRSGECEDCKRHRYFPKPHDGKGWLSVPYFGKYTARQYLDARANGIILVAFVSEAQFFNSDMYYPGSFSFSHSINTYSLPDYKPIFKTNWDKISKVLDSYSSKRFREIDEHVLFYVYNYLNAGLEQTFQVPGYANKNVLELFKYFNENLNKYDSLGRPFLQRDFIYGSILRSFEDPFHSNLGIVKQEEFIASIPRIIKLQELVE